MTRLMYWIKQACFSLQKKPGFVSMVVSTMSITIGALLCALTLAYVLIVSPLPYPEQDRLYQLEHLYIDGDGELLGSHFTYPSVMELYKDKSIFSDVALSFYSEQKLNQHPLQPIIRTTHVNPEWFQLLGATMALGRTFEQTEELGSNNPVAVLSYQAWVELFSSDPDILEKTVRFWDTNYRVIGVLSPSFIEPQIDAIGQKTHIFMPWDFNPVAQDRRNTYLGAHPGLFFFGKLASDKTISQIEQALTQNIDETFQREVVGAGFLEGFHIVMKLNTLKSAILKDVEQTVWLLLASVTGLLVIAIANIANQFISRTAEKLRHLAIHAVLGAKKRHIYKLLFAEAGLLMAASVMIALVIADNGFYVMQEFLAKKLPRVDELSINLFTMTSAILIALSTALLFAWFSANMINYRKLNASLQTSGKGTSAQVSRNIRQILIVSQVTVVTVLIFVSFSIFNQASRVINQSIGFDTERMTTVYLNGWADSAQALVPTIDEVKHRLAELPQIEGVSNAYSPMDMFDTPSQTIVDTNETLLVESLPVDENYFDLVGQTLMDGYIFSAANVRDGDNVIIINHVYASKLAPYTSALGMRIRVNNDEPKRVIGIVKGIKIPGEEDVPMRSYYPWPQDKYRLKLLVKHAEGQEFPAEEVIRIINEVGSGNQMNYNAMSSWEEKRDSLLFTQYTTAVTSAALVVLSFFLAAIGLYGILSYSTQLRQFELGTRMAIGAKRKDLVKLIVKDNFAAFIYGAVLSVIALLGLYIGFASELSEIDISETQTSIIFLITLTLVAGIMLLACYWPLRRYINQPAIYALRGNN
ncbi:ABC transporter permease [Paraneptunicella aestuarii]|uniref:ABC transporter permease n=1 Tax=Paraneptunicella aestuarii TaxID=2831148 RepID=UPI001E5B2761|nr:ABC transporter permease [Paraneptunicella aestuarii]UAA39985.1 ABC transporter permease [Paraneptunicella aestuarii]